MFESLVFLCANESFVSKTEIRKEIIDLYYYDLLD